jgi:hypothetical protein
MTVNGESEAAGNDDVVSDPFGAGDGAADAGQLDQAEAGALDKVDGKATEVERPLSRRQAAAQRNSDMRRQLEETRSKVGEIDTLKTTLDEMRRSHADLTRAITERGNFAPSNGHAPPRQDDAALLPEHELEVERASKEVEEALVKGDHKAWMAATAKVYRAISRSELARFQQTQPAAAPQVPPEVAALRMEYHKVLGHPAGEAALRYQDAKLAAAGMQPSYERVKKAYEAANADLFGNGARPSKADPAAARARAAHSAAPAAPRSAPSSGSKVRLPSGMNMDEIRRIAKAAKMTPERYLEHYAKAHPEDVVDD